MTPVSSNSERQVRDGGSTTPPARTNSHLRFAAVLLPALVLLVSSYLLFTDPSSASYECPGSTYTLLGTPAVGGAPEGFFDADSACNEGARDRTRAAVTVMLTGLSLALLVALASTFAARAERQGSYRIWPGGHGAKRLR